MEKTSWKNKQIEISNMKGWIIFIAFWLFDFAVQWAFVSLPDYLDEKIYVIMIKLAPYVTVVPMLIYAFVLRLKPKSFLEGRKLPGQILIGFAIGIMGALLSYFVLKMANEQLIYIDFSKDPLYLIERILYLFFAVALFEEFRYRFVVQEGLSRLVQKQKWLVPILSGLLFGLIHVFAYDSILYLLMVTVMGIVYGIARQYLKLNIIGLVIAHGSYDLLCVMLPFLIEGMPAQ